MAEQEDYASDQLKHDIQSDDGAYPERPTNTHESRRPHGKGARTEAVEVEPAQIVELTPQQRAVAVQALTELLTHHLDHESER